MIPLRDHIDMRFKDIENHFDKRLDALSIEVRLSRAHKHKDKVGWKALTAIMVPAIIGLVGLMLALPFG